MGKEHQVEIPPGSGNRYRYAYDPERQATIYKGPVGEAPPIGEEDFLRVSVWTGWPITLQSYFSAFEEFTMFNFEKPQPLERGPQPPGTVPMDVVTELNVPFTLEESRVGGFEIWEDAEDYGIWVVTKDRTHLIGFYAHRQKGTLARIWTGAEDDIPKLEMASEERFQEWLSDFGEPGPTAFQMEHLRE